MIKVIIKEGEKIEEKRVNGKTIEEIMKKLNLPTQAYVSVLNGEIVSEKEEVKDGDIVELLKVWSGG